MPTLACDAYWCFSAGAAVEERQGAVSGSCPATVRPRRRRYVVVRRYL